MIVPGRSGLEAGLPAAAPPALQAETRPSGIDPASLGVVAFVGRTLKGPLHHPVPIADFAHFQQVFGGLWDGSLLPHAVEQFFEHGGARAVIVRVACGARPPSIDLPAGRDRLTLTGLTPGSGETLRASVDYDGIGRHDTDLFNLVVQRVRTRGSELVEEQEIFRRLSILPGSAQAITRKLADSQLVRVAGALPDTRPDITRGRNPGALIGYVDCNGDGEDGEVLTDYDLIGSGARRTGLFALQGGPAFNFLYLPPPARDRDVGMAALAVGARFCREQHAMLLVDAPARWRDGPQALEGLRAWPLRTPDALMFFPRIRTHDRLTHREEEFPSTAAAMGTLLREAPAQPWLEQEEPALLRPSARATVSIEQEQQARLCQLGVNTLRTRRVPRRDVRALCTLAGEMGNGPEARLLSARRLALHLASSIQRATQWVVREGNTARSRERACRQVAQLLSAVAEAGAFAGAARNRDWFVVCDERLNPPDGQAAGTFRLVWGYQARDAARLAWLVEHDACGSWSRPVSLNQFAALG